MIAWTLLLLAPAFVCTRAQPDGPSVFWQQRHLEIHRSSAIEPASTDVDDGAVDDAIAWAATQWTGVACSDVALVLADNTDNRVVGFDWKLGSGSPDNQNIVVFRHGAPDDPLDAWLHALGALAITTVTFESGTGELLDADVEVNDAGFAFSACDPGAVGCIVTQDLKNTLTHEFGHVLGLDHPDNPEATMFASASQGDVSKRDLFVDDVAGLCALYPTDAPAGNCYDAARVPPPNVRFESSLCSDGLKGAPESALLCAGLWWRRKAAATNKTRARRIR